MTFGLRAGAQQLAGDAQRATAAGYIAPLDGLRAMAIAAVLLFHAQVPGFRGGFLGVDVFFVISGYIITRGLIQGIEAGTYSYGEFLKRRFARLIPSLVVTVALTSAAAFALLSPRQLTEYAQTAISALVSGSNWFFWLNSGYFDGEASAKPLLHTWSLGVEEQFYLLWPLALALIARFGRLVTVVAIGVAILASLLASWLLRDQVNTVFYLTPFRVYQFGAGALIATARWSLPGWRGALSALAGLVVLLLLYVSATGVGDFAILESVLATGAAVLLMLGLHSKLSERVLGNVVVSAIGRRGYAIYLVHWPLAVLGRVTFAGLGWAGPVVLIACSFLLGELLYRFVETPLRFRENRSARKGENVLWGTSISLAIVLAGCAVLWGNGGFPERFRAELVRLVQETSEERPTFAAIGDYPRCEVVDGASLDTFDDDFCMSAASDRPTIAVFGDSFGLDTVVGMRQVLGDRVHIAHVGLAGCLPLDEVSGASLMRPQCRELNSLRLDLLRRGKIRTVVLAGFWSPGYFAPLTDLVAKLSSSGYVVYVTGIRANFDVPVPDYLLTSESVAEANRNLIKHLVANLQTENDDFRRMVRAAGGRYIEVLSRQCRRESCPAVNEANKLMYIDGRHLSLAGARLLGEIIRSRLPRRLGGP